MGLVDKIALPIRGVQAIFAIIVIAISGYITGSVDHIGYSESRSNFNLFTGLWTLVVVAILMAFSFIGSLRDSAIGGLAATVLDGLTWLFWLAAFACIAAVISGNNHLGLVGALTAFGVLEWLLFSVTFGLALMATLRGGSAKT